MSSSLQPGTQIGSLGRKILKAMLIIIFFWVFWKFGGFLMNLLIARYLGASREADAYFFVYKYILFMLVYSTTLKVLMPAFMPVFLEEMEERGEEKAWEFVSAVLNLTLLGSAGLILGGFLLAPRIASFAEGFDAAGQALATSLLRWMLPGVGGLILAVLTYALLNSYKIFDYPAAGDAAQKLVWALVLFGTFRFLGFAAVAVGFLAGCAAQLLVNGWGLRTRWRLYRFRLGLSGKRLLTEGLWLMAALLLLAGWWGLVRSAASYRLLMLTGATAVGCLHLIGLERRAKRAGTPLGKLAALSAPLLIGVLFARYRDFATAFFQSYTATGVFADLEYARSVGNLPNVLIATALSFAMFPYLCELATRKDLATFAALMTRTLRLIALFFIPLTVAIMVLDEPLMQLIFDRGQFPLIHLHYAGQALSLFIFGLFFYAIENVLMQSFFSMQQMWWPTVLGMVSAVFHTLFLGIGINVLGYNYPSEIFVLVAISFPVSRIFKNLILLAVMRTRLPIFPPRETLIFLGQMVLLCAVVGGVVYASFQPLQRLLPVNPLKEREVMVDTFNFEPRGWFSLDADELEVIPGARSLHLTGPAGQPLTVDFPELPRDQLLRVRGLRLWARAEGPVRLTVRLHDREEATFERTVELERPEEWQCLDLEFSGFQAPGPPSHRLRAGRLTTCSLVVLPERPGASLWIDSLALLAKGGQVLVLEDFETAAGWGKNRPPTLARAIEPNHGGHALWAHYRRSARRQVSFRRELTDFRLEEATELRFTVKATLPGQWSVQLVGPEGPLASQTFSCDQAGRWQTCSLKLPEQGLTEPVEALILEDETATPPGSPQPIQFWIDNLRFRGKGGTEIPIDDFEQEGQGWTLASGSPQVDDTGEGEARAEQALRLPAGAPQVQRDLRGYRLEGTSYLRCKIRAERPEKITLVLETRAGQRWQCPLEVRASGKRKPYEVPLAQFRSLEAPGSEKVDAGQVERLVLIREAGSPGTAWLDNLAFHSQTPVVAYEGRKLIRVGVPGMLGTIAFIVLIFLLRVEEAGLIAHWLRTEGLAKIKAKLGGRGG